MHLVIRQANPDNQSASIDTDPVFKKVDCRFRLLQGKMQCIAPDSKLLAKLGVALKASPPLPPNPRDVQLASITSDECWPEIVSTKAESMGGPKVEELTQKILYNVSYTSNFAEKPLAMTDGQFPAKIAGAAPPQEATIGDATFTSGYDYQTRISDICFGDLNRDGRKDAVVLLESPMGADGLDLELVPVVNINGQLFQVGDVYLGHAIRFLGMKIEAGVISVRLKVHDLMDSVMSPSKQVVWKFRIDKDRLFKLRPDALK